LPVNRQTHLVYDSEINPTGLVERADFNKVFNLSFGELLPKLSSSETLEAGAGEVTGRFALVTYSCDRDFLRSDCWCGDRLPKAQGPRALD
jgi:hypothetical protein